MIGRLTSILLVIRGGREEKAAIQRAARLAKEHGARLTAMRVLGALPRDLRILGAAMPASALEKMAVASARGDLEKSLRRVKEHGSRVQMKIVWGKAFIEVIREVLRKNHDLVILNASAKSELRTSLFGSMTMRLMRKCPCPVWVVKTGDRARYSRVLAALGPEDDSDDAEGLNSRILDWAAFLAARDKSELHVVHAWELSGKGVLRGRAGVPQTEIARMEAKTRKLRKEWLMKRCAAYPAAGEPGRIHLVKGPTTAAIPRFVRRKNIDLLVMGTISRIGIAGFLMGNTAEKILGHLDCSVLTLKPAGFVTPVKVQ